MRISDWSSDVCSSDLLTAVYDVALDVMGDIVNGGQLVRGGAACGGLGGGLKAHEVIIDLADILVGQIGDGRLGIGKGCCDRRIIIVAAAGITHKIGRAHVCTQVTNAHLVCLLLLEKKNTH